MRKKISDTDIDELRHYARMMVRELGLLADAYQKIGITLAERHLLLELQGKSKSVNELAESLLLDKSTTSRLVSKAVEKGFVAYTVDDFDKRRRHLALTKKGMSTLAAVEPIARKQVRDALSKLPEGEVNLVRAGLRCFAKGLADARKKEIS